MLCKIQIYLKQNNNDKDQYEATKKKMYSLHLLTASFFFSYQKKKTIV